MTKKYFFFDIDGTLTDRTTHQIVPSSLKTLHLLQEQGHFVALATGRAHYKAIHFMQEIGLKNMVCNGGFGLVLDGKLVENKPLDYEKCIALYEQAQKLGYGVLLAYDDSQHVYTNNLLFLKQAGYRKEPTIYHINDQDDISMHDKIYKMYISIPESEEEQLTLKDTVGHMRFEKEYLMFQGDDKQAGILKMMEILGGNLQDVVVFGDDTNDINMFSGDWHSIAMGNACDELKMIASEVTEKNVEDGIYLACLRHGWILKQGGIDDEN